MISGKKKNFAYQLVENMYNQFLSSYGYRGTLLYNSNNRNSGQKL